MATSVGNAYVDLDVRTDGINKSIDKAGKGIVGKWAKIGLAAGAAFGGAIVVKGIKDSIVAASDLNEAVTKSQVIFGSAAKDIEKFSKSTADAFGISRTAALDASSTFATFGKAAGLSEKELAPFSTKLVELSADLASFYNTSPEDAIQALGSALRGESEPMRRYGVLLNDATLKEEAMRQGIIKTTKGPLPLQAKVLAANAVIMKQTADAQGDFARTSDGMANQSRILSANMAELKTRVGEGLLPIITKILPGLNKLMDEMAGPLAKATEGLGDFLTRMGESDAVKAFIETVKELIASGWEVLVSTGKALIPIVQSVMAVFSALSPIMKLGAAAASGIANAFSAVARASFVVNAAILTFIGVLAANKIAAFATSIAAVITRMRALTVATTAAATAQMRLAPGLAATGLAASGMGRAMLVARTAVVGLVASMGPIGWAAAGIGAVTAGIMALRSQTRRAVEVMTPLMDTIDGTNRQIKNLKQTLSGSTNSMRDFAQAQLNSKRAAQEVKTAQQELAQARKSGEMKAIIDAELRYEQAVLNSSQAQQDAIKARDNMGVAMSKQRQKLVEIRDGLMSLYSQEKLSEGQIRQLGDSYSAFGFTAQESLDIARKPLADQTAKLREGLKQTSRQMAGINTPEVKKFKKQIDRALKAPNTKQFINRIDDIGVGVKGTRKVVTSDIGKARKAVETPPKVTWGKTFTGIAFGAQGAAADTKTAIGQVPTAIASQEPEASKASKRVAAATTKPLATIGTGVDDTLDSNFGGINSKIGSWEQPLVRTTSQAVQAINSWLRKIGDRSSPVVADVVARNLARINLALKKGYYEIDGDTLKFVKGTNKKFRKLVDPKATTEIWARVLGLQKRLSSALRIARNPKRIGEAKQVIQGLINAMKNEIDRRRNVVSVAMERVGNSVATISSTILSTFDRMTAAGLANLNKLKDELTATEGLLAKKQGERAKASRKRAKEEADAAVIAAQAALAAAEDPNSGAWAEDIQKARDDLAAAKRQQDDAAWAIEEALLQEKADAERKAREDERARETADYNLKRENMRNHFEQTLAMAQANLRNGSLSAAGFTDTINKAIGKMGVTTQNVADVMGSSIAGQFGTAMTSVVADAVAAAQAIKALFTAMNKRSGLVAAIKRAQAIQKALGKKKRKKKGGGSSKKSGRSMGVPEFAKGAVVNEPTLALIGETRRATPEIVTPERLMRQIMREEGGATSVRVFIGDKELTDLVRTEIIDSNRATSRAVMAGAR